MNKSETRELAPGNCDCCTAEALAPSAAAGQPHAIHGRADAQLSAMIAAHRCNAISCEVPYTTLLLSFVIVIVISSHRAWQCAWLCCGFPRNTATHFILEVAFVCLVLPSSWGTLAVTTCAKTDSYDWAVGLGPAPASSQLPSARAQASLLVQDAEGSCCPAIHQHITLCTRTSHRVC